MAELGRLYTLMCRLLEDKERKGRFVTLSAKAFTFKALFDS